MKGGFFYSSPAEGGKKEIMLEHTHHVPIMSQTKNAICPSTFGKWYQNDYIAAGATSCEAQASDTT